MTPGEPNADRQCDAGCNGVPHALRIAIVGGGITGLAAAHRIVSQNSAAEVTIFEGSERLGGIIQTETADGFLMELGPDSFITNKPGGVQLCSEIDFTSELIPTDNTYRRSLVLRKGRPLPVPDGFMLMAPAKPWAIATTPVLSIAGKLRLLRESFVARRNTEEDESLASFVRRRFGAETLDRLVQPLVGGIYTSDPEKLSLKATLPRFLDMEREYGSVTKATRAEQKRNKSKSRDNASGSGVRYGLFTTPNQGLSSLIAALETTLQKSGRVTIRSSTPLQSVAKSGQQSGCDSRTQVWDVRLMDGRMFQFDSVIITLPTHKAAALLLDDEFQSLNESLKDIEYASSAVVVTGHRLDDFTHPLDAFGLVIPAIEKRKVLAVSFTSRKFPHRAPPGHVLLRTFVGGAMQPELLNQTDAEMVASVNVELTEILGMKRAPLLTKVTRYTRAMPQYHVGHLERVARIETLTRKHHGLYLAGSAYHGVGIPDSIASGRAAADLTM